MYLDTEHGVATFKGTLSNPIAPDSKVLVLNGVLKDSVGIVKQVTGNVYRSDNKIVVIIDGELCWFFPWDLKTVQ